MGILASELRQQVIRPTLERIELWSEAAEVLLLGTAAHESKMGYYLKQVRGPALGIYQIEPATHNDIWTNTLAHQHNLSDRINTLLPNPCSQRDKEWALITNLAYSTAIARVFYYRVPHPLPAANDIEALAKYWKRYYNTEQGKGKIEDFIQHYNEFVINSN